MAGPRVRLGSIRQRLIAGFSVLVLLLLAAGIFGRAAIADMSIVIRETLGSVQSEGALSSRLTASVAQELNTASAYHGRGDSLLVAEFRRLGSEAHRATRDMNKLPGQTPDEIALVAAIDAKLSALEIRYAHAHRLADLGRMAASESEATRAREMVNPLLADVQNLGSIKARGITAASDKLGGEADRRAAFLIVAIAVAVLIAIMIVINTVRWITRPLGALVIHARELSDGNLAVRTTEELPGEFRELASAMNTTAESLSKVASVATITADDVSSSAHDLSEVAEQISVSASQMASSMSDITEGAESQVAQLRQIDEALRALREGAEDMQQGADTVNELAGSIEHSAQSKRTEIVRAMGILTDVRTSVQQAAAEVVELNRTAENINKFVASVSRIAEQTDLLALNAAIEAARAGQAGRGFAVVADEVRKLAEQAQAAADDVVQLTSVVTARVATTTRAMDAGVSRVGEIERVSRDIDMALDEIGAAAARTREAACNVTDAAGRNSEVVNVAALGVDSIARTAEGHAAAAQEVSAATQEQSAACEQMSSASSQLLAGSTQLRELVGGLKTSNS
ncbi:MAG TPA: methyl-accepting chemotaxis protein [Gemmatimonadaceae bacterium]|nr:methyl-accepting chemotaxis protein [Gemmatimonadaceae bacterium]